MTDVLDTIETGFVGEDEIPKGPYACRKCRRVRQKCVVETAVVHFKFSGENEKASGFYETWALKCLVCGGSVAVLRLVEGKKTPE